MRKTFIFSILLLLLISMSGCEKEGPAERAGKAFDENVEKAGDSIEEAAEKLEDKTDN